MAEIFSPVEAVGVAIATEQAGRRFYQEAARKACTPAVGELFEELAREEAKHEQTYSDLQRGLKETPAELPYNWDEAREYLSALSRSRLFMAPDQAIIQAGQACSEADVLDSALQFEKETLLFYQELAGYVGPAHQPVMAELIRQERLHILRLAALRTGK
jgi:rubrerythrin